MTAASSTSVVKGTARKTNPGAESSADHPWKLSTSAPPPAGVIVTPVWTVATKLYSICRAPDSKEGKAQMIHVWNDEIAKKFVSSTGAGDEFDHHAFAQDFVDEFGWTMTKSICFAYPVVAANRLQVEIHLDPLSPALVSSLVQHRLTIVVRD
jgi:hypothetical protein